MKRKALAISLIGWMLLAGLEMNAAAEEGFKSGFHLYKQVSSQGENYGIKIKFSGDILRRVDSVSIKVPYHKKSTVDNWLRFNEVLFSADNMTRDQFNRRYPEGRYIISLVPSQYGTYSVDRRHDFTDVTVTYPEEGDVDVPTKPTVQWTAMTNVDTLTLRIESEWGYYSVGLAPESTSYEPYWTLDSNSEYTLYLEASLIDPQKNRTVTTYKVSFKTGE